MAPYKKKTMPSEPGLNPDFSVYYGGTHFNFHSMAFECAPENFGSEDQVVFIRETYAITGVLVEFQQGSGGSCQTNIHAALDRVREDLMTKRLRFKVKVGGVTLIDHGAANDFDGGPTPKSCKITEITGGLAARIAWTVEIARPFDVANPYFAAGQGPPWHTYLTTVQIDDRFLSTRVIRGSVRRATRCLGGDARGVEVLHKRIPGFKRERKWNVVRDGHQIDYEITDKELYLAFPKPVTNGKAVFEIGRKQVSGQGSIVTWKTIKHLAATYEAPKGVAKRNLAALLLLLAASRFGLQIQAFIVTSLSFSEDIFGGTISLDVAAEGSDSSEKAFFDEQDRTLGRDVPGAGYDTEDRGPFGTANINPLTGTSPANPTPPITPAGRDPGSNDVNSTTVVGGKKRAPIKSNWGARGKKKWSIIGGVLGYTWSGFEKPKEKWKGPATVQILFSPLFGDAIEPVFMKLVRIYEARAHLAVLKPMVKGSKTIIQTTAEPTVTVTEYGAAQFMEDIPAPSKESSAGVHEEFRRVIPSFPQEDAAGQLVCPIRWVRRFILE